MTTQEDIRTWMEGYVRAWATNHPADIEALFTDDARYFTAPFREPWAGRQAIVEGWVDRKDDQGSWTFQWEPVAVDGEVAVIRGVTNYPGQDPEGYSNLWVLRLDGDGRCSEFVEWWMEHD